MSVARLLVLGAVIEHEAAHGYQVRKDLESWSVDLWGGLGQGSIYHALRQLTSQGLLRAVEVQEQDTAPARTLYQATSDGRSAFMEMLEETLASPDCTPSETMGAIGFLTRLTRERAMALLDRRIQSARAKRDRVADEYERLSAEEWGHHAEAIRFWVGSADADIAWAAQLVDELRAGSYVMADDASNVDERAVSEGKAHRRP